MTVTEQGRSAALDLMKRSLEMSGYRVLTPKQFGRLDRAIPHELGDDLRCLPECHRCDVAGILH